LEVKVMWSKYLDFYVGLCVVEHNLIFEFEMRFV